MQPPDFKGDQVFATPWFQILRRQPPGYDQPFYAVQTSDFAVIVALNSQGQLLLVRQFRPVIGRVTLELPAGHIEPGETPEEAARKELCEETGHEADTLELLATLSPSTARFTNRMWIFFAPNARPAVQLKHAREAGVECVFHSGGIRSLLDREEFVANGSCGALFVAAAKGKVAL